MAAKTPLLLFSPSQKASFLTQLHPWVGEVWGFPGIVTVPLHGFFLVGEQGVGCGMYHKDVS